MLSTFWLAMQAATIKVESGLQSPRVKVCLVMLNTLDYEDTNTSIAHPNCNSTCGNVEIPFPFVMNEPYCYADQWFEIECRKHTPYLKSVGVEVSSIDVSEGTIEIMHPIHRWNCKLQHNATNTEQEVVNLRGSPFVYSQESNKFMSVGCNKISFLVSNGTQVNGCVSVCDDNEDVVDDTEIRNCNGQYCCVTSLPLYLSEFNVTVSVASVRSVEVSPTSKKAWKISPVMTDLRVLKKVGVVLEWEIHNSSITLPCSGYCVNTNITSAKNNHSGRRCYCRGYSDGNPYIEGGCSHVDASTPVSAVPHAIREQPQVTVVGINPSQRRLPFCLRTTARLGRSSSCATTAAGLRRSSIEVASPSPLDNATAPPVLCLHARHLGLLRVAP
ncbi:Wall-associated receptor kinase-like [Arachis hypogaea]|nr:Wall-associated receptor kinase-like [Arachis hypogaea]